MPPKPSSKDMDDTLHTIVEKLGALQCQLDSQSAIAEKLSILETQMANQQSLHDSRHNTLTTFLVGLQDQVQSFTTIPQIPCTTTLGMPLSPVLSHNMPHLSSTLTTPTSTPIPVPTSLPMPTSPVLNNPLPPPHSF